MATNRIGTVVRLALFFLCLVQLVRAASPDALLREGNEAYRAADYPVAAQAYRNAIAQQPAAGTLQNLGSAEWQRGRVGPAILAWEQSLWLDPSSSEVQGNLRYARNLVQLEAPELAWYETGSAWLPVNAWPWITAISLWTVVAMLALPGILLWKRTGWQQALAALALGVLLLCLPAHLGIWTRSQLGFIQQRDVPLRLTPTQEAESVTRLAAGEPARLVRTRGVYAFIRTSRAAGWVEREQFGLICPR